jgi:uncharacterized LabA/DUF88 family protein
MPRDFERTPRLPDSRLKIAVFIDFDNIEIGVKTTLGGHFDVGAVLEAIKERGEVVTKVAYGDWTRAGDYSRSLTQHAIQMVQRNLTPGGDKNGADINLALDALELAFTHNHINAFVIVGGDSDFMALVEKLKLYDRQVFVVGGRAFTSVILQKNCTEFIAYENVTGRRTSPRGGGGKDVRDALPLVKRALKVLTDREVTPQLGVLKSTLLQLDSTFSEREYGVSTFRDFVQKLERAGGVTLRGTDRSLLVELRDTGGAAPAEREAEPTPVAPTAAAAEAPEAETSTETTAADATLDMPGVEPPPPVGSPAQQAEGFGVIKDVFSRPGAVSRWPLYVRQAKQLLKNADEGFDERRYGFNGILDALRYCQREGLFRLDRDRQGVIRIYPGDKYDGEIVESQPRRGGGGHHGQPRAGNAAALPLDDHLLDTVIDGNKLPPGETAVSVVPATAARRRRVGRGRVEAELPVEVTPEAAPDVEPIAVVEHVPVHEEPAPESLEGALDVELDLQTAASEDAGESGVDESPAAKAPARKRTAAPRKRAVKKAVKKTTK